MRSKLLIGVLSIAAIFAGGCASSYVTPGRGADLNGLVPGEQSEKAIADGKRYATDGSIQISLDKKPLATFPTAVAVVRIQAPGYTSRTSEGWGFGRYSVVTTRDIEKQD